MADEAKKPAGRKAKSPVVTKVEMKEAAVAAVVPAQLSETLAAPVAALKEGTEKMTDTVENTVKDTVKKVEEVAKTNMEKGATFLREAAEFSKANLEALVETGKIAAAGAQTYGQSAAEVAKKAFEANTAQFKQVAAVKSPTEFMKLQSDFARSQFDAAVAEASKSTEFFVKLAGDMMKPLQNRYSVATDMIKTRLAA